MSANYSQLHDDDDHDITHPHHDHDHDSPLDPYSRFDFGHLFGDYSAPVQEEEGEQFDDAYRAPPAPYSTGFFDHILNPAGLDHGRYSPFAWHPYSPLTSDMAPTTRARPDRLANGYVDLTSAPDSPPPRRKRESPTPGPSAKRQKKDDGSAAEVEEKKEDDEKVQELDLTEQKTPLQEALQKQQEDAVKAQAKPEETVTTFNSFNCVICMDNPTDLTATACGRSALDVFIHAVLTNYPRPPLLPHLPHGSPHRR